MWPAKIDGGRHASAGPLGPEPHYRIAAQGPVSQTRPALLPDSAQEGFVQAAVDGEDLAAGLAEPVAHEDKVRLGLVCRRDR